jgi:tRNA G18 (ribose-2'-O)-methylase SpoU
MKKREIYLICQNIRSLFNVGSIFRTADAFGVKKIYLCGITGHPPNPKIAKVALGAENSVAWEYARNTAGVIKKLKSAGVRILALEQSKKSVPINKFRPKYPTALIIGNEVTGVSGQILKISDRIIEIPMFGAKESLNVVQAMAIGLYILAVG